MTCLCKEIAGDDIELSPTCIGILWIFQDLDPKDIKTLSEKISWLTDRVGNLAVATSEDRL